MRTQTTSDKRGAKRKLESQRAPEPSPRSEVRKLIDVLTASHNAPVDKINRVHLRKTAHALAEYCKSEDLVGEIVKQHAIEAVVPLLALSGRRHMPQHANISFEDIEKEACFILGLLAVKPEYQLLIARQGALSALVTLLVVHQASALSRTQPSSGSGGVARRAADAITNLAHENVDIKNKVRAEGGIPPLVALLESLDLKVQRAAAGALRTLAFKNEDNKSQIVRGGALPILIQMLRSEDVGVHYEAVGVIGNLVHSSVEIKRQVLQEGALQPVIGVLSSPCPESQREAALLLGQFATTDAESKSRIVQRGAVPPLVRMLSQEDAALREMAAFALGRLAQNPDNQAGIVAAGGLRPLLSLLESKHYNLQHNAAFALYGLSDNEDNVPDIITAGGYQKLLQCSEQLQVQASKDCVHKTIQRIRTKLEEPRVLAHTVYCLRSCDRSVRLRVATALARLAPESAHRSVFVERPAALDVLLGALTDANVTSEAQAESAAALLELSNKVNATAPIDAAPAQPAKTVYLGEEYVNSSTLADVTFLVEGREFYAHRIALLASSVHFKAMFDGGYREAGATSVPIEEVSYDVFGAMMRYIYTGTLEVDPSMACALLQAADKYLLEGLKRLCESSIAANLLTPASLPEVYELSETFSAPTLGKRCVLYALEHYTAVARCLGGNATGLDGPGSSSSAEDTAALGEGKVKAEDGVIGRSPKKSAKAPAVTAPSRAGRRHARSSGSHHAPGDESSERETMSSEGAPAAGGTATTGTTPVAPVPVEGVQRYAELMARMVPLLKKSLLEELMSKPGPGGAGGVGDDGPGAPGIDGIDGEE